MKLLNIGCGSTFHPSWTNIDLVSSSPYVQNYDIRQGLPYADASFEACYSSHLLEHLTPHQAKKLLIDALRVLKPRGMIRVVVPDLEAIVRTYLTALEEADSGVSEAQPKYDWMMLELYDQATRQCSGGEMARYFSKRCAKARAFVVLRIGCEAHHLWSKEKRDQGSIWAKVKLRNVPKFVRRCRLAAAKRAVALLVGSEARAAFEEGLFRHGGEVHRWMYDRFSLRRLLEESGFAEVRICRADESRIPDFNRYNLDVVKGQVRKPDSLFMEGTKP